MGFVVGTAELLASASTDVAIYRRKPHFRGPYGDFLPQLGNGDTRSFIDFTGNEPYVFYSNVFNLSDEDYELLHRNYVLLQSYSQLGVRVELYSKTSHTGNEK